MQRTTIEWADFVYNPIIGCLGACPYCYARRLAPHVDRQRAAINPALACPDCRAFTPHFHEERLWQVTPKQKPALIFADSMSDLFGPGVKQEWKGLVFLAMSTSPQHRFVVLTKRPDLITSLDVQDWPPNAWLGVSITCGADWWRWETLAALKTNAHRFVSVEPLLGPGVGDEIWSLTEMDTRPEWIIVGPQSKPSVAVPIAQQLLLREAAYVYDTPLFEKAGLPIQPAIRQMPPDLAGVFRKGGLT